MSRIRKAVVAPSSLTALSSGGGGGCTFNQWAGISLAEADPAKTRMSINAGLAALRIKFRILNIGGLLTTWILKLLFLKGSIQIALERVNTKAHGSGAADHRLLPCNAP